MTLTYEQRKALKHPKVFRNDRGQIYRIEMKFTCRQNAGAFLCELWRRLGDRVHGADEALMTRECLMIEVKTFFRKKKVVIKSQGFGLTPFNELPDGVFRCLDENGVNYGEREDENAAA